MFPSPRARYARCPKRPVPLDCKYRSSTLAQRTKSRRLSTLVRDQIEALFVSPDAFFISQRAQLVTLAARYRIPAAYTTGEDVEAGGLMSYGADNQEMWHQVGIYTGQILKGAKPADLPVLQTTKFEFLINLRTAKALGIEVPSSILLLADEVIE